MSGDDLIRTIRTEFGLTDTRVILHTDQQGPAHEREVILNCEIDGYVDRAELTAMKLFPTVVAALRAYQTMFNLFRPHVPSSQRQKQPRSRRSQGRDLEAHARAVKLERQMRFGSAA
jgi:hypothetical protein